MHGALGCPRGSSPTDFCSKSLTPMCCANLATGVVQCVGRPGERFGLVGVESIVLVQAIASWPEHQGTAGWAATPIPAGRKLSGGGRTGAHGYVGKN
jgi:hypothetical protein